MQRLIVDGKLPCTKEECATLAAIQLRIYELAYIKAHQEEKQKQKLNNQSNKSTNNNNIIINNTNNNNNTNRDNLETNLNNQNSQIQNEINLTCQTTAQPMPALIYGNNNKTALNIIQENTEETDKETSSVKLVQHSVEEKPLKIKSGQTDDDQKPSASVVPPLNIESKLENPVAITASSTTATSNDNHNNNDSSKQTNQLVKEEINKLISSMSETSRLVDKILSQESINLKLPMLSNGTCESIFYYIKSCSCLNVRESTRFLTIKQLVPPNYQRTNDIIKMIKVSYYFY
jgi:hypothetical protein